MEIHQIMPSFLYGDAVGNQAFRIRELLRQWGFKSQVYAQFRDQRLSDRGKDYAHYRGNPDNIVIFHYASGSPLTEFVRQLPDKVIPYYHNVTPPEFMQHYNPTLADRLERGRRELLLFRDAPFVWADSEYNRQEMLALEFDQVTVMPLFINFDEMLAAADSPAGREIVARYDDGWVNLLFVGRVVPNKCQDDLIRAFNYYHQLVNPRSRLILIGSDLSVPGYRLELETMTEVFGIEHVHIPGVVSLGALGGYYQAATIFLCLSEHEGFGIPLLEAMAFDVPVLAFNATGVPYAMGEAGILVNHKRYDAIGELIDLLAHDEGLRQRVIARQHQRLADFAPSTTAECLRQHVDHIVHSCE
ncbi:MAG: glycosyltransferase family 4 protein [Chloroflexi bacterium]|nr:glycosyltransferase family 4 protein [Chloroflexota bacterium]